MDKLLFSIVTVCYNAENCIERTMESILGQNERAYEYILIDGKSTDATVDIIKYYEAEFNGKMRWISEKDQGIYDAMNKAIDIAKGTYVIFINAGDELCKNILKEIRFIIKENGYPSLIYGDSIMEYSYNKEKIRKIRKADSKITMKTLGKGMGVIHQSILTRRDVFEKIGTFNITYSIGADWDLLIRCVQNNLSMLYIDKPISIFEANGISSKVHNIQRHRIRKNNHLYKAIDIEFIKDIVNIGTMIQLFIGKSRYIKLRYWINKKKQDVIR